LKALIENQNKVIKKIEDKLKPLASVKEEVMKSFNEKFVPALKNIDKLQKNIDSL
jgi:hypothetical protein